MVETPFILLTQAECPRCERLKMMLEHPLRGKYQSAITVVHRQNQPGRFREIAEAYGVRSTPVIIECLSGKVLANADSLGTVKAFLEQGSQPEKRVTVL